MEVALTTLSPDSGGSTVKHEGQNAQTNDHDEDSVESFQNGLVPYSCGDSSDEGEENNGMDATPSSVSTSTASTQDSCRIVQSHEFAPQVSEHSDTEMATTSSAHKNDDLGPSSGSNSGRRFRAKKGILRDSGSNTETSNAAKVQQERSEQKGTKRGRTRQLKWANDLEQVRLVEPRPYPPGYFEACSHRKILEAQLSSTIESDEDALQFAESFGFEREQIYRFHQMVGGERSVRDVALELLLSSYCGQAPPPHPDNMEASDGQNGDLESQQRNLKRRKVDDKEDDDISDVVKFLEEAEQEYSESSENSGSSNDPPGCIKAAII